MGPSNTRSVVMLHILSSETSFDKAAKLKHSFEVFRFWHFHFHEKVWNFHPNVGSTLLAVEVEGVTTTFSSVTTTCALNLLRLSSPLPSSPHQHSWKLLEFSFYAAGLNNLWQPGFEKMEREWENEEEMEREGGNGEKMRKWKDTHSLHFLIFTLFPPSLSISYIKNCLILSQNVKYGKFVANVKEIMRAMRK